MCIFGIFMQAQFTFVWVDLFLSSQDLLYICFYARGYGFDYCRVVMYFEIRKCDFSCVESFLHPRDKSCLVMVYETFSMILDSLF